MLGGELVSGRAGAAHTDVQNWVPSLATLGTALLHLVSCFASVAQNIEIKFNMTKQDIVSNHSLYCSVNSCEHEC